MSTLIIKYFFYIVSFILFFKFELTRYSDQLINVKFFNIGLNNVFTFAPSSLHQQLYKCAAPIPHSPFYKLKNEEKKNIHQNYTEHSNMYFRDSIMGNYTSCAINNDHKINIFSFKNTGDQYEAKS